LQKFIEIVRKAKAA